jgi:hypothetical protein
MVDGWKDHRNFRITGPTPVNPRLTLDKQMKVELAGWSSLVVEQNLVRNRES